MNRRQDPKSTIEEGLELVLDFKKLKTVSYSGQELLPVIVQNAATGEVLLLAYGNEEAIKKSLEEQKAFFWSTSRDELWCKGESSGDYLDLLEIRVNCEQNSLLYRVLPRTGGVCHTRDSEGKTRRTCFYRRIERHREEKEPLVFVDLDGGEAR